MLHFYERTNDDDDDDDDGRICFHALIINDIAKNACGKTYTQRAVASDLSYANGQGLGQDV